METNGLWKKGRGLLIPFMKFSRHKIFYKNSSYNSLQAVNVRDFAGGSSYYLT